MKIDKVEKVKNALEKFGEDTLKKILTRKKEEYTVFYRHGELTKWLEENHQNFTAEELKILGYTSDDESTKEITTETEEIEVLEKENHTGKLQEITNGKEEETEKSLKLQTNTDVILGDLLSQDDIKEKFIYFLTNIDEFLGIKKQMDKNLVIPSDLLKSESVGVTVRLWKSTLEEFNKFCEEHKNYTKLQLMSYALTEFMEKYK
uniref:Uncharacterized protein n=1 Tax=uncultured prokaryote TaxID=198431 RepID=A0A0H5PZ53_9ZZZZ|nr:hypothetical protein [uncultured prokaryote]